jgi:4-hydroxybenzoate polyprenyltransferase
MPLPARMLRFIGERFPLQVHGVSILMFFATNAAIGGASTTPPGTPIAFGPRSLLAALALGLMFLRLRLFDEVKDYGYDLQHNPTRPLPRGLLSVREMNLWAAGTAVLEGSIAAVLGPAALSGWAVTLVFTILMRVEFFMRALIRPRLFTYALLHTPSGGLIGLFVYCAVTGRMAWDLTLSMGFYVLAGWGLLMVFELARKTYDPTTEPGPDTYSSVFGGRGAAAINAAFVLGTTVLVILAVLAALRTEARMFTIAMYGLTAIVISVIVKYGLAPSRTTAKHLRIAAQAYLVLASILSAWAILHERGIVWRGEA